MIKVQDLDTCILNIDQERRLLQKVASHIFNLILSSLSTVRSLEIQDLDTSLSNARTGGELAEDYTQCSDEAAFRRAYKPIHTF